MDNGPFIDGLPIKNGDFPVRYVKLPEGIAVLGSRNLGLGPRTWQTE